MQMGADASLLEIYDGGSEQAEIIKTLNAAMNNTKISTPRNQISIVLNTNRNNPANIKLNVAIIESKYSKALISAHDGTKKSENHMSTLIKTRLKVFNPRPRVELSHFISNFQKNL